MSHRYQYMTLKHKAAAKGIRTFGDIAKALGMDGEDVWGPGWDNSMKNQMLFWCDGAFSGLESLDSEGLL